MIERRDITGVSLVGLVIALWRGTRAIGMGRLHDRPSLDEADLVPYLNDERWLRSGDTEYLYLDYVYGRPLKVTIARKDGRMYLEREDLYDRDAGPGACERALASLQG